MENSLLVSAILGAQLGYWDASKHEGAKYLPK